MERGSSGRASFCILGLMIMESTYEENISLTNKLAEVRITA